MANEKNLKPNSERTPSERRELASRAGKASGEARRRKRDAQAAAKLILNLPALGSHESNLEAMGVDEGDFTNLVAMMARMYAKAAGQGDVGAARFLVETMGGDERRKLERDRFKLERERFEFEKEKHEQEMRHGSENSDAVNDWIDTVIEESVELSDNAPSTSSEEEDDNGGNK